MKPRLLAHDIARRSTIQGDIPYLRPSGIGTSCPVRC